MERRIAFRHHIVRQYACHGGRKFFGRLLANIIIGDSLTPGAVKQAAHPRIAVTAGTSAQHHGDKMLVLPLQEVSRLKPESRV